MQRSRGVPRLLAAMGPNLERRVRGRDNVETGRPCRHMPSGTAGALKDLEVQYNHTFAWRSLQQLTQF